MGKQQKILSFTLIIIGAVLSGGAGWLATVFAMEKYFLLAPAGVVLFMLITYNPKIGVYLLLLLLAIVPPAPQEIGLVEIVYVSGFAVTILAWLIRRGWMHLPNGFTHYPIVAILGLCLFSIAVAIVNDTSLYHWLRGIIPFTGLFLFYIAAGTLKTKTDRRVLVGVLYIAAFTLIAISFGGGIGMLGSAISHNNFWILRSELGFGAYQPMVIGIPLFAFGYIMVSSRKLLLIHYAACLFFSLAVMLTFLRSVYLIFFICAIVAFLLYARVESMRYSLRLFIRLTSLLVVALLMLMIVMPSLPIFSFISSGITGRFEELSEKSADENVRVKESKEALSYFLSSPIVGKGLGFQYQYERSIMIWKGGYTHNIFTYFAMTLGSLGLVALLWFIISVYKDLRYKTYKWKFLDLEDQSFLMGAILYLLALLLYVQFQSVFRHIGFFTSFCIMLGALINIGNSSYPIDMDYVDTKDEHTTD